MMHHPNGDFIYESETRSTEAEVARPRMRCLRRGDESEEESNGGCGVAPARCVIAVVTTRQPARGPDSVVSLCRTVYGGAAALWRQVLHGGGLLGVV